MLGPFSGSEWNFLKPKITSKIDQNTKKRDIYVILASLKWMKTHMYFFALATQASEREKVSIMMSI